MPGTAPLGRDAARRSVPRLGFLGAGWIGRNRLKALSDSGLVTIAAIADPASECEKSALELAPCAATAASLDGLLGMGLDGVVIATPSALHAEQTIRALEAGVPVFCQKPLGRNAAETLAAVDAANRAGLLLGVDLSYRHTAALRAVRDMLAEGAVGEVFAADLTFHNAYGPDKPWFYDPLLSGGGCVADLGIHLVDALLWCLDFPKVAAVSARLYSRGAPLAAGQVEDYAAATVDLAGGLSARIACSWNLSAGCDAEISIRFYGTGGTAVFENVGGSFHDFRAMLLKGTTGAIAFEGADDWGGRAAVEWADRLAAGEGFDPAAWRHVETACVIDRIYGRTASAS